ncbi:PREDICTED: uncharacterized protein LOC109592600 isoform X2 [Amphimedon queenslandica]|nr:PREDICTED: uncharacterized protein LOC109592600 isoform X2 [Amphimedon queenslandica]|eukprot:XP_019863577.1 PREDICTED: uncharacterized protein LOC109592600 isoform X2 [Amphimedon queenslandica]
MAECSHLSNSSSTALVLPPTPLKEIISDYKERQATNLMVQSMGNEKTWRSLWEKLQQTLTQIDNFAQSHNLAKKQQSRPAKYVFSNKSLQSTNYKQRPATSASVLPPAPSPTAIVSIPSSQSSSSSLVSTPSFSQSPLTSDMPLIITSDTRQTPESASSCDTVSASAAVLKSPRKKLQPSKRKRIETTASSSSSSYEQFLDDFLHAHSNTFPNIVADFINSNITGTASGAEAHVPDAWLDDLLDTLNQPTTAQEQGPSGAQPKKFLRFESPDKDSKGGEE